MGAINPPSMAPPAMAPLAAASVAPAPVAAATAFSMLAQITCSYRPDACFKVDHPCKLCTLVKKNAREGSYTHEKTRPEGHSFELCYANPHSPDFKVDVYQKCMHCLVENKVDIPNYMQPLLLKAADA